MIISTRSLVEGAFLISISVIMYLLGIYNLALGVIATLLCPVPIVLLVLRHNNEVVLGGFFVSSLLLLSLAGILESLTYVLQFFLPSYVMGYFIKKESPPEIIVISASVVSLLTTLIFIFIASQIFQKDMIGELFKTLETSIKGTFNAYQGKSISETDLAILKDQLTDNLNLFKRIYPGIFICATLIMIAVNYEITRRIIDRLGHKIKPIEVLNLRIPEYFIWGFICSFLLAFINFEGFMPELKIMDLIAENILIVYLVAYFIQGLSISILYMKKWRFPAFIVVTNVIFFLLTPLWLIPMLLGIFDFWFNFKNRILKINQT